MIKYALACDQGHEFEGWFSNSGDYDVQSGGGLLHCPVCGSEAVTKQIMAPAIAGTKARGSPAVAEDSKRGVMMEALGRLREHVEDTFDNMGDRFADEARAIHEGRSEERGIYGEATPAEVRGLVEDGVPVAPLPPRAPKKTEIN